MSLFLTSTLSASKAAAPAGIMMLTQQRRHISSYSTPRWMKPSLASLLSHQHRSVGVPITPIALGPLAHRQSPHDDTVPPKKGGRCAAFGADLLTTMVSAEAIMMAQKKTPIIMTKANTAPPAATAVSPSFEEDFDDQCRFHPTAPNSSDKKAMKSVLEMYPSIMMKTTTSGGGAAYSTTGYTSANGYQFASSADHRRAVTSGGSGCVVGATGVSLKEAPSSTSPAAAQLNPDSELFSVDAAIANAISATRGAQVANKERRDRYAAVRRRGANAPSSSATSSSCRSAPPSSLAKQMAIAAAAKLKLQRAERAAMAAANAAQSQVNTAAREAAERVVARRQMQKLAN